MKIILLLKSLSKLEDERKLFHLVEEINNKQASNDSTNSSSNSSPELAINIEKLDSKSPSKRKVYQNDHILDQPLLIIIRHGKTEHNKLGLFTGWEDANLAQDGRDEALHAGRVIKSHGIHVS
jgi:hypothetical protein